MVAAFILYSLIDSSDYICFSLALSGKGSWVIQRLTKAFAPHPISKSQASPPQKPPTPSHSSVANWISELFSSAQSTAQLQLGISQTKQSECWRKEKGELETEPRPRLGYFHLFTNAVCCKMWRSLFRKRGPKLSTLKTKCTQVQEVDWNGNVQLLDMAFISITNNIFEPNVFIYSHFSRMKWEQSPFRKGCKAHDKDNAMSYCLFWIINFSRCSEAFIFFNKCKIYIPESRYQQQLVYSWKFKCITHEGFSV